jgi:hypothetical protein
MILSRSGEFACGSGDDLPAARADTGAKASRASKAAIADMTGRRILPSPSAIEQQRPALQRIDLIAIGLALALPLLVGGTDKITVQPCRNAVVLDVTACYGVGTVGVESHRLPLLHGSGKRRRTGEHYPGRSQNQALRRFHGVPPCAGPAERSEPLTAGG